MKDVYYKPSDVTQTELDLFTDNIKEDRTPEDLLIQVMLDLGGIAVFQGGRGRNCREEGFLCGRWLSDGLL